MSKSAMPEAYDSLDAPVYVWEKVHSTSDLSYLLVKRKKIGEKILLYLKQCWEKLYDEYIAEFGFGDQFKRLIEKKKEIAEFRLLLIITKDRIYQTEIEIAEIELAEMEKFTGKSNFTQTKIAIEDRIKYQLGRDTTIREFYTRLSQLNK